MEARNSTYAGDQALSVPHRQNTWDVEDFAWDDNKHNLNHPSTLGLKANFDCHWRGLARQNEFVEHTWPNRTRELLKHNEERFGDALQVSQRGDQFHKHYVPIRKPNRIERPQPRRNPLHDLQVSKYDP